MDTSTNKVREASIVHFLCESGIQTRCGLEGVAVTLSQFIYGKKTDDPVDCMTCLVDRPLATTIGGAIADAFIAKCKRTMR